jgi:hypothetical protein
MIKVSNSNVKPIGQSIQMKIHRKCEDEITKRKIKSVLRYERQHL